MPHCASGLDPGQGSGTSHLSGHLWPKYYHWGWVPRVGLVLSAHDVLAQGLHMRGEQRPSSSQSPGLHLPEGPGWLLRCCPAPRPAELTAKLQQDTRL